MKNSLLIITILLVLAISYILPDAPFNKQKELFAHLLQISSILLAVSGAWIAIIYPQALKNIINNINIDDEKNKSSHS